MINYFEGLGFGNFGNRQRSAAQGVQNIMANKQNIDASKLGMEQKKLVFANEQQKQKAAQGAGAFYNALNSGNEQAALQIAQQYQSDINSLGDPTFTADSVAKLMQTPEGKEQLKKMSLGMVQLAAGPEQVARFTAQQAKPVNPQEATAQIKNTAEYRRYTLAIREALKNGNKDLAKDLSEERDFFVKQTDPYQRSLASGTGAAEADFKAEENLNPVLAQRTKLQEEVKAKVQSETKQKEKQTKDFAAYSAYQVAAQEVGKISGSATGGMLGLAPAFLEDDRLFEGAIAILRPAIKDVVRGAGEGTFTDADQELMNKMLPSRLDSAEVKAVKLQMLDNYVRAKLGQSADQTQSSATQTDQPTQQPAASAPQRIGRFVVEVE